MRNTVGLTARQIEQCQLVWEVLSGNDVCPLDVSEAHLHNSRSRYVEGTKCVKLGADALPGPGVGARTPMSLLACLAHELAHAKRHQLGFARPAVLPHALLDEAETSIHASFELVLGARERCLLVEDAHDQVGQWLAGNCGGQIP